MASVSPSHWTAILLLCLVAVSDGSRGTSMDEVNEIVPESDMVEVMPNRVQGRSFDQWVPLADIAAATQQFDDNGATELESKLQRPSWTEGPAIKSMANAFMATWSPSAKSSPMKKKLKAKIQEAKKTAKKVMKAKEKNRTLKKKVMKAK